MSANYEVGITTTDNPYNPLTNYDEWERYDHQQGYDTSEYLARVVRTTNEFGDGNYANDIERAIDEIVLLNLIAMTHEGISYVKVTGEAPEDEGIEYEENESHS